MRIDGVRPVPPKAGAKRAEGAAAGFSVSNSNQTAKSAPAAATGAMVGIDSLLALQAEDSPMERRRRAVKNGRATLDALDSLKLAMLEGRGGTGAAQTLASAAQPPELTGEAGLDDALQQISVRAAVELAKLRLRA